MIKLSKNLFLTFILCLVAGSLFAQSKLPPCEGEDFTKWTNCFGMQNYSNGEKYVGEYKNGKANGQGEFTEANGSKYVGQYKNDMEDGQGTYTYASGVIYMGQFKNGKANGQGSLTDSEGKYVGQFKDGKFDGQGTMTFSSGSKYIGQWKNDKYNGQGAITNSDGSSYVGQWKDNKKHGQGVKTLASGGSYSGQWKDDEVDGRGTLTNESGLKVTGVWKNNELIKDESPKPPPSKLINLVCMVDNGPSKDLEFQYSISPESNFAISLRGKQPSDVFVTKGTISFKQGEVHIQISRLTGKYSQTVDGSVMGTGNCKPTEQVKPKF